MKVGLFVTGHFRNVPQTHQNYAQFLDGHDTSVYVATWSNRTIERMNHHVDLTQVDAEGKARAAFGDSLKGLWVGDMGAFINERPPASNCPPRILWNDYVPAASDPLIGCYPWPQRVLDQWYAVLQAYLLAEDDYDTFDLVIRIRGDQLFIGKPPIPFHQMEDGIHVNGYTWWTNPEDREQGTLVDSTGLVPYALSDQLAWGKPYWMRKYFEYYLNYCKLWAGKLTTYHGSSHPLNEPNSFLFNSEHLMSYYLLKCPYYHYTEEMDMPWHRHGHDSNPNNRFDADYYYYDP